MIVVAILAGAGSAIGLALNARLAVALGHPVATSLVNFAVGLLTLLVLLAATGGTGLGQLAGQPWWAFVGGACGAIFLTVSIVVARRAGVAASALAAVLGQVAAALALDSAGLLGAARPITPGRVAGALLLLIAVWLVQRARAAPVAEPH